jgi:hypothetical protein
MRRRKYRPISHNKGAKISATFRAGHTIEDDSGPLLRAIGKPDFLAVVGMLRRKQDTIPERPQGMGRAIALPGIDICDQPRAGSRSIGNPQFLAVDRIPRAEIQEPGRFHETQGGGPLGAWIYIAQEPGAFRRAIGEPGFAPVLWRSGAEDDFLPKASEFNFEQAAIFAREKIANLPQTSRLSISDPEFPPSFASTRTWSPSTIILSA